MDKFDLIKAALAWAEWHDERSVEIKADKISTRIWVYDSNLSAGMYVRDASDLDDFDKKAVDDQIHAAELRLSILRKRRAQNAGA